MKRLALAVLLGAAGSAAAPPPPPAPLAIARPTLHYRQEDGPAIPDSYEYLSGELLHLSFRVSGFKVVKDRVDLRWQIVAVDQEGRLLVAPSNGEIKEEVSYNDKDWMPKVQQMIALPAQLPPGVCKLKLSVADELANSTAEKEIEFRVGGRPLPKVEAFSVLTLRFYRTEADRQPLEPAVYHPGETLIARFELAGYQLGEKNRFEVDYGLAILDATDKQVYAQPEAAADSGAPFYPQRLLNGALTLNLTAGVLPSEYTLVVKARDVVGKASAEARAKFKVEK